MLVICQSIYHARIPISLESRTPFGFCFDWELALLFFAFLLERFPLLAYGHGVRHYPSQRRRGISHLRENVQLLQVLIPLNR